MIIKEYDPAFQKGINQMMQRIQDEYPEPITTSHSTRIIEVYKLPRQKYWVAVHEGKVAGTIGMVLYSGNSVVVKRMMVDPEFRGKVWNTASLLMEKGFDWARNNGAKEVYLGTMTQFIAAQKFYERKGFIKINKDELPADYSANPMDSIYYRLVIDSDLTS